jgi:hypothetical protein
MSIRTRVAAGVTALGLVAGGALLASPAANASTAPTLGDRSLADVLLSQGVNFDNNPWDYDVLTHAVLAVLKNDPSSPVSVLTDGSVPLTAFLPTDRAFAKTVHDLTGKWPGSERRTFAVVASLGLDTVEAILEYHVVPGVTIDSSMALQADGVALPTALPGKSFTVDVINKANGSVGVRLIDAAPRYPYLVMNRLDINEGNNQIAHRIGRVLLP